MKILVVAITALFVALLVPRFFKNMFPFSGKGSNDKYERLKVITQYKNFAKNIALLEKKEKESKRVFKVGLGYNSNVDLVINAMDTIHALVKEYKQILGLKHDHEVWNTLQPKDYATISTLKQLLESFSYSFKSGSAIERFIVNEDLFNSIVAAGISEMERKKHGFKKRKSLKKHGWYIGGNAALMATKMSERGWNVLLSGAIGPKLKKLLQSENMGKEIEFASVTKRINQTSNDNLIDKDDSKQSEEDEIHVIMEYDKHDRFLKFKSPRANRYIATRDIANAQFLSLDKFHDELNKFSPDLVVLAGFGLLDGQSSEERKGHFMRLEKRLKETKSSVKYVHVELQSIGNREIYSEMAQYVFPYVNSIGLNEQELESFYQVLSKKDDEPQNIANRATPCLKNVSKAMQYIFKKLPSITRIHFHSLTYHFLSLKLTKDETKASKWTSEWGEDSKVRTRAAVSAVTTSSLTATTQACGLEKHSMISKDPSLFEMLYDVHSEVKVMKERQMDQFKGKPVPEGEGEIRFADLFNKSVLMWNEDDYFEAFVSPVLVCKKVVRTVGLGDAISASGLSAQVKQISFA